LGQAPRLFGAYETPGCGLCVWLNAVVRAMCQLDRLLFHINQVILFAALTFGAVVLE